MQGYQLIKYKNIMGKKNFTNTYITGSGRQNYLRIDGLEDPLFTGFTFDIDYITSPLFYTINYDTYGYPNVEGMDNRIKEALKNMYDKNNNNDNGYDILPVLSANILDGNKMGFGLQQNVYMDLPLYGATEYIYMVDRRNGGADQNDVRYDSNTFVDSGGSPNSSNSYKLGDSVKSIVNESDKAWAENTKTNCAAQVEETTAIMKDPDVANEHAINENTYKDRDREYTENLKIKIDDVEYDEKQLENKINELKAQNTKFIELKRNIADWVNVELQKYKNEAKGIYDNNKCVQEIFKKNNLSNSDVLGNVKKELEGINEDYVEKEIYDGENSYLKKIEDLYNKLVCEGEDNNFFLNKIDNDICVNPSKVVEKTGNLGATYLSGYVIVKIYDEAPDWVTKTRSHLKYFIDEDKSNDRANELNQIMKFSCNVDEGLKDFNANIGGKGDLSNEIERYEGQLNNLRQTLYGIDLTTGGVATSSTADPQSIYGRYMEAKEQLENDDFSQAQRANQMAQSGVEMMGKMIEEYDDTKNSNEPITHNAQQSQLSRENSIVASQTVLDMLGFITGMKKMTTDYPYIIQGVTGLDKAYEKNYGIKDPYLGSGDDKITLTCLESLDLRVSSMFNRYFNAVYDRQYRRERVPVNLRRFNCFIYVHDIRNFVSNNRIVDNKMLELTDMYYSVIEFRFYDCEIVPEETGNIFNNVSNESPSDMTKTNFTFTYGNCVVNFVPPSESYKK
jgi:hypothetical protein